MRSKRHGVSLAEAIVACFILTAAMAVSAALFHTALNHSVRIDRRHRAARVVERKIEEIRAWSRRQHGTNGPSVFTDGWNAFDSTSVVDPEYPEFTVKTKVIAKDLYSPSSAFEEISFAAQSDKNVPQANKDQKRKLNGSSYLLEVTGSWGPSAKDQIVMRTLLADPVKDYGWSQVDAYKAIELSSTPSTLAPGQSIDITATIKDANGRVVNNPVVEWYIDPHSSGSGTIETRPDASDRASFINLVKVNKDADNPNDFLSVYPGGSVRIVARVRLGGLEAINKTANIELSTPPE